MRDVTKAGDLRGKYVLLRTSLDIPLRDGRLQNHLRLLRALPTMRYLREQGARTIVLAHIGRNPAETLRPICAELERYLPVHWGGAVLADEFNTRRLLMSDGDILMAENVRQYPGEKTNDPHFAASLAALGEVFVNDAFAAAHRQHASTYGVAALLPSYAGLSLVSEVRELERVMQPTAPALFLLGGAKFDTKLPLVEKYLELYDRVFIGGALANDIFKAKGFEVGRSVVSGTSLSGASFLASPGLLTPIDVLVDGPDGRVVKRPGEVSPEDKIVDCGPRTIDMLGTYIDKAKTILWNGPFGMYEIGCTASTEQVAQQIAASNAYSVVGGGDTVAAIEKLHLDDQFGFVSIGGGSMLTFLELGGTPVTDLFIE